MKTLDRFLQSWRMTVAARFVRPGDELLDVGCHHGEFLFRLRNRLTRGLGVDPLAVPYRDPTIEVRRGVFPDPPNFPDRSFSCISILAVLEHHPDPGVLARECFRCLKPGGRVILTVPHPRVDSILKCLKVLHLVDGMALEEHHRYDASKPLVLFTQTGFRCLKTRSFQLGLNFLYVFEKPG